MALAPKVFLIAVAVLVSGCVGMTPPPGWVPTETPVSAMTAHFAGNVTFVLPIPAEDWALVESLLSAGRVLDVLPPALRPFDVPASLVRYMDTLCRNGSLCACSPSTYAYTCAGPGLSRHLMDVEWGWDVGFASFVHPVTKTVRVRASRGPALPPALNSVIEFVAGLGATPPIRGTGKNGPGKVGFETLAQADPLIVGATLRATYGIPADLLLTASVSIGLAEFQDDLAYWDSDLEAMSVGLNVSVCAPTSQYGPFDNSSVDGESALDASVVGSLSCGADIRWLTFDNWMWEYAHTCTSTPDVCPNVTSISWGWWEEDQCSVDSAACSQWNVTSSCGYAARVDKEFGLGALLGKTHVVASGDAGCHGRTDEACDDPACRMVFPCSSQWVTCVSATAAQKFVGLDPAPPACQGDAGAPCASVVSEAPCFLGADGTGFGCQWTPGGGVSTCIPRPKYQSQAVKEYLESKGAVLPPAGDFGSGRGGPDVAALGHNMWIMYSGSWATLDGTSASTPVWASLLTYVNQARLNQGLAVLGAANPFLYSLPAASSFFQVQGASNNCTEYMCCDTGFASSPETSWNAVTGLGSVRNLAAILPA